MYSNALIQLCNVLIQPHFDYACSACYPNLNVKLKILQIIQNKYICFCLKLEKICHISEKDIKTINWLLIKEYSKASMSEFLNMSIMHVLKK